MTGTLFAVEPRVCSRVRAAAQDGDYRFELRCHRPADHDGPCRVLDWIEVPVVSGHLVDEHGKALCPEYITRDALPDAEFWERVATNLGVGCPPDDEGPDQVPSAQWDPCPLCGERGACGYDDQGRPLIHALDQEDEQP